MRKPLKFTALLSFFLILSILLSSCGVFYFRYEAESAPNADELEDIEGPFPPSIQTPSYIDFGISDKFNPEAMLESFYTYDFDGAYVIATVCSDKNPLFPDSGLFADANLYTATEALQQKFNISLTKFPTTVEDIIKTLSKAQPSDYADIVAIPLSAVSSFEGKDFFYEISSLPFVNKDAEYFSENKNISVTGQYFIAGSASYRISDTKVIYFNTELLESLGGQSPYTLLTSKEWTWDKLCEYLALGKGIAAEDDILSVIAATAQEKGEGSDAKVSSLAENISSSLISEDAKEKFLGGEAIFYLGSLGEASEFNQSDSLFGLLPIPLFEKGDDYKRYHNSDDITVFACAKGSSDLERASLVISAANAACYGSFESFFFTATKSSFLRDNGSNISLGYICSGENAVIFPVSSD